MATKYNIYTEDGKHIDSASADEFEYGSSTTKFLVGTREKGFYVSAVIPINWAVIEVQ